MPSLFVLSGPSGVGKSTLIDMLCQRYSKLLYVPTVTTRKPRNNEVHGKHYYFVSQNEYNLMSSNNVLIVKTIFNNMYYGLSKENIISIIQNNNDAIITLDISGIRDIKNHISECQILKILIMPPSIEVLKERLILRHGQESNIVMSRLELAQKEMLELTQYDMDNGYEHIIVNDNLLDAFRELSSIYEIIQR